MDYRVQTWQRVWLMWLHTPLWVFYKPFAWMDNLYFNSAMWMLCTSAIVLNLPQVVVFMQTKPTYLNDLESSSDLDMRDRRRFQHLFLHSQQALLIIAIPLIIDYYMLRYQHFKREHFLEYLVLTYGALSLVATVASYISSALMIITVSLKSNTRSPGLMPSSPSSSMVDLVL